MHNLSLHIAWRYLFSPKGYNAIHIVTGISAVAIGVVTAAMVCVMSVMNGFGVVVEQMFSRFDPDIRITSVHETHLTDIPSIDSLSDVSGVARVVMGQAMVEYHDHTLPAIVMGVDSAFDRITGIDDIITDGLYCVWDGGFDRVVMGQGLANQLGVSARFIGAVHFYAPKRGETISLLNPEESIIRRSAFMAGEFATNQAKYDDHIAIVSIEMARELFGYHDDEVSAIYVQSPHADAVRNRLRKQLGPNYHVHNRYEQQADFFRIMRIEKLMILLMMIFILLIASFNLIGSLTMLRMDKREDNRVLAMLGMRKEDIRSILLTEGLLVSLLGAGIGLVIGIVLCLAQEHFGLLKLGSGTEYVLSSYPVHVEGADLLIILIIVIVLSYSCSWIASRTNTEHT